MAKLTVEEALEVGLGSVEDVASHHHEQLISGEGVETDNARFIREFAQSINDANSVPHTLAVACAVVNQFFMSTGLLVTSNGTEIVVLAKDVPEESRELIIGQLMSG